MPDLMKDVSFAVIDVETTGLSPNLGHKICEIGILRMKNGVEEERFESLVNPGRSIPFEIECINGISDELVKDSPLFREIAPRILSLMKGAVLVYHNASFDMGFISRELDNSGFSVPDNPVIDTLMIARRHFDFQSNSLINIARFLDFEHHDKHRAMGDVLVTWKILEYFIKELGIKKNITMLQELIDIQGDIRMEQPEKTRMPDILKDSSETGAAVTIRYITGSGYESTRRIKPLEATLYKGNTYIIAYCCRNNEQRVFRLDRILGVLKG